MRTLALLIVAALISAAPYAAQGPSCDAVAASPEKFIGQTVTFYGSAGRGELRDINGATQHIMGWTCKTPAGDVVPNAALATLAYDSTWTPTASAANPTADLFRVSGVVARTDAVSGRPMPFLTKAHVELASEAK